MSSQPSHELYLALENREYTNSSKNQVGSFQFRSAHSTGADLVNRISPPDAQNTSYTPPNIGALATKRLILLWLEYSIRKSFGKAIMRLGDTRMKVETISVGHSLGSCWVAALKAVIEIYGPESSGKTTVALHAVAGVQKLEALPPLSMLNTP